MGFIQGRVGNGNDDKSTARRGVPGLAAYMLNDSFLHGAIAPKLMSVGHNVFNRSKIWPHLSKMYALKPNTKIENEHRPQREGSQKTFLKERWINNSSQ